MELYINLLPFLSWRNNLTLISKVKDEDERQGYINQNIENAWNNVSLEHHIECCLYERQAIAEKSSNYERLLESPCIFKYNSYLGLLIKRR